MIYPQLDSRVDGLIGCVQPWACLTLQGAAGTPLKNMSRWGLLLYVHRIQCGCGVPHGVHTV